jgi:chromosome partitioning protein
MRIWTIANQKGGVGKTTTTVALGGLLAARGQRTLMIDLDPHASLTAYFNLSPEGEHRSIYDAFLGHRTLDRNGLLEICQKTSQPQLYLLPGHVAMATIEKQMAALGGQGLILQQLLDLLSSEFQWALIDCPPVLGVLMVNALAACQHLIVPVQTEYLAIQGLERMERTLAMINRSKKQQTPYLIVPTMFDRRTRASVHCLRQMRDTHQERIWRSVIPIDTRLRDASSAHLCPHQLDPESRGVVAYQQLLRDLLGESRPVLRQVAS